MNERACYDIKSFCKTHEVSKAFLYKLWSQGLGPKRKVVGSKILITVKDAKAWLHGPDQAAA